MHDGVLATDYIASSDVVDVPYFPRRNFSSSTQSAHASAVFITWLSSAKVNKHGCRLTTTVRGQQPRMGCVHSNVSKDVSKVNNLPNLVSFNMIYCIHSYEIKREFKRFLPTMNRTIAAAILSFYVGTSGVTSGRTSRARRLQPGNVHM